MGVRRSKPERTARTALTGPDTGIFRKGVPSTLADPVAPPLIVKWL